MLDRNFGDHPRTVHGIGWQRAWEVAAVGPPWSTLTLRHDAAGEQVRAWPFAFAAEQRFMLTPDALHLGLTLRNLHRSPAPAGLGLHPYFFRATAPPRGGSTPRAYGRTAPIRCRRNRWPYRPSGHSGGQRTGSAALDNCFAGWDGEAHSVWASDGPALRIGADAPFRHLIVYTPPGQDFFCVEPVSHMNDAINRMDSPADDGLRTLAPGETLRGRVTFGLATAG